MGGFGCGQKRQTIEMTNVHVLLGGLRSSLFLQPSLDGQRLSIGSKLCAKGSSARLRIFLHVLFQILLHIQDGFLRAPNQFLRLCMGGDRRNINVKWGVQPPRVLVYLVCFFDVALVLPKHGQNSRASGELRSARSGDTPCSVTRT